jgi:glycosyltransferase involved in cell wall biosynthesis
MRVLFNTYPVAFDCPGGGEIQLLRNKEGLERLGVEVILFDPWHPQFDRVDLVHYFSVQGGSMNFCGHVKRRGLPLVISPILWLTEAGEAQYPMGEIHALLHAAGVILPNSDAEKNQLADRFGLEPSRFRVIPNGVSDSFRQLGDLDLFPRHADLNGPFVLTVANIEPRKNQLGVIAALQGMDMPLILAGNVRDQDYFRQCMVLGGEMVRYVGYLDHDGPLLRSAYRSCELFVLAGLLETPGLAALEAATQGAGIVITEVGSTREYFEDMVTYVNPTDVESIRSGIELGLTKGRDGRLRDHVLQSFTWDHAARALRDAYGEAVNKVRL